MSLQKIILDDAQSLITAAAERFVEQANAAIAARGVFYVALAGGSTPKGLYQKLTTSPFLEAIDWNGVHLFFGDERCVAPSHDDSNFKMARLAMIDHLPIPEENVHRMPTETGDPDTVAKRYAQTMERVMEDAPFDLILLGLGPDGHIASLFPDTEALAVTQTRTTSVYVEKFNSWRVTLTYPVINAAREVVVFISGEAKQEIVQAIGASTVSNLPVQRLSPAGKYVWMMDRAAAGPA